MSNFVFTGTFKVDGEHVVRDLLIATLVEKGHSVQTKVTYGTDYLVQSAQGGVDTVKHKTAVKLGVPIISPNEFWKAFRRGDFSI
jgi:NAD-dependent DNA ligase